MSELFVSVLHNYRRTLNRRAAGLRELALSFERTGNVAMADQLTTLADDLEDECAAMVMAHTTELGAEVRAGQRALGETLEAALAMKT